MLDTGSARDAASTALLVPKLGCKQCARLVEYRHENKALFPDFHNGPVSAFGGLDARLLIVGMAPGLKGANRTGRPFTGDGAGNTLYPALIAAGLASGQFDPDGKDDVQLHSTRITNAVRCVPPKNKVTGPEIRTCGSFLIAEIEAMDRLHIILGLGLDAHKAVLTALGERPAHYKFAHGSTHRLGGLTLLNSYHFSRYNTNTGRLTPAMVAGIFTQISSLLA